MPALKESGLLDKLNGLGEQAASGTGIEIVEIQLRGAGKARLLRVYIDKPQGVTHGDCEVISERLGALLDAEEDILQEGYTLEVSSPGVERQLSKPRDFERVVGQKIRFALRQPIDGQQRFEGKLTGFAGDALEVEVAPEQTLRIPREQIQKANLKFEW
jgi:ribosome maturation factor RimP